MTFKKVVLGLDSSAYTTSLALVDLSSNIVQSERIILDVPLGKRGLRQQEAVFQHIKNYPQLIKRLDLSNLEVVGVACTTQPRNIENSYMPVFEVSKSFGESFSHTFSVPFFEFSHQEGHIEAGMIDNPFSEDEFLSYHLSGGTSELLLVKKYENRYQIEIIGGSKDISAGKLIDRIGVAMNLKFPAGKEVDKLACQIESIKDKGPVSVKDTWFNLSGAETYFYRKIESEFDINKLSYEVLDVVAKSVEKTLLNAVKTYGNMPILLTGGVSASDVLRNKLKFKNNDIYYPVIEHCTDNAIGIANLGVKAMKG